jgi:hypothetical protein
LSHHDQAPRQSHYPRYHCCGHYFLAATVTVTMSIPEEYSTIYATRKASRNQNQGNRMLKPRTLLQSQHHVERENMMAEVVIAVHSSTIDHDAESVTVPGSCSPAIDVGTCTYEATIPCTESLSCATNKTLSRTTQPHLHLPVHLQPHLIHHRRLLPPVHLGVRVLPRQPLRRLVHHQPHLQIHLQAQVLIHPDLLLAVHP